MQFPNKDYLANNPDVDAAIKSGKFNSGYEHYLKYGYLEGRQYEISEEEKCYLQDNPDVDAAIKSGKFNSGYEHYLKYGYLEGRQYEIEIISHAPKIAMLIHSYFEDILLNNILSKEIKEDIDDICQKIRSLIDNPQFLSILAKKHSTPK